MLNSEVLTVTKILIKPLDFSRNTESSIGFHHLDQTSDSAATEFLLTLSATK